MSFAGCEIVWRNEDYARYFDPATSEWLRAHMAAGYADLPGPRTLQKHETPTSVRPANSIRAYYVRMPGSSAVLGVKGAEVTLIEQLQMIAAAGIHRLELGRTRMGAVDFFLRREHRLPVAVTVAEAMREVEGSTSVFSAYFDRYQENPNIPLALAVLRFPKEVVEPYRKFCESVILNPVAKYFGRLLLDGDGIGCLVQYYPSLPDDRLTMPELSPTEDYAAVLERLNQGGALERTIQSWIRLFVRFLALGFLPGTYDSFPGSPFQPQNALLTGGVVDFDTIVKIEDAARSMVWFHQSYYYCIAEGARLLSESLFERNRLEDAAQSHTFPHPLCVFWFLHLMEDVIADETKRHGDTFHPELKKLPPFSRSLDGLFDLARRYNADFKGTRDLQQVAKDLVALRGSRT